MIWQRYLLKEILKVFFLFLLSFYFLYGLIDYSTHMQDFLKDAKIQIVDIVIYYYHHFIKRAGLLLPLALLVSTIKVLTTLTSRGELTALQMAALPLRRLLQPFFFIAISCLLFNFICIQSLVPSSLSFLDRFRESHFKHSFRGQRKEPLHVISLKDHSKLAYQTCDQNKQSYFDVVWIRSSDDIWRMKYLNLSSPPIGRYVDHLERNKEGVFEKTESFDSIALDKLKWQRDFPSKGFIPLENRSLSELYRIGFNKKETSLETSRAQAQLYHKCLTPFLAFLAVIAVAPICAVYRRTRSLFLIYALSIFGFIAFTTLLNAGTILGENHLFSPFTCLVIPFIAISTLFVYRFFKYTRST